MTLANFLTDVGSLVTAAVDWMGDIWTFITGDPILMCVIIGLPIIGLGIGLLTRLFRVN